jgi:tRNA dimethylallyltransferase
MEPTKEVNLLAIVGPTASGKSELAIKVAELCPAEIIAADSRTIYKGMDVGTAKPTWSDQKKVVHWGIDLIKPNDTYSAQDFQNYAKNKIKDVRQRGKLPILVGGTGLYIDSVLYSFEFTNSDLSSRPELESLSIDELQGIIEQKNLPKPENWQNRRHLIRTIERKGKVGSRKELSEGIVIIGLLPPRDDLRARIAKRAEHIFQNGVVSETKKLIASYGEAAISKNGGIVYKICTQLINGQIDEQTARDLFIKADWQYARRQRTWFKRNQDIVWFDDVEKAFLHLKKLLNT